MPSNSSDARRARRIDDLLTRGIESAWAAYVAGRYPEDYGQKIMDWIVVGSPLALAHGLLRRGDAAERAPAVEIIESVLAVQERHPRHPHRGNWPRRVGDTEITDLNSAPFIARWLVPLLCTDGDWLPAELLDRCRESLGLALDELVRLNVAPTYTNIHLMSLFGLIVGGEWLGDERLRQIGLERWAAWVAFTVKSGAPREYNSATYMGMNLTVLASLQALARDPATRLQARLMYERFWLHAALHIHRPTRQLAGPHARCYWTPMTTGRERLIEILWRETEWSWLLEPGPYEEGPTVRLPSNVELALTEHWLPSWAAGWMARQELALPYEVRETASIDEGHDLTTYLTPSYALGVASRTYSTGTGIQAIEMMANHMLLHYATPARAGGWGMAYARYVVNDQHWGTLGSFITRKTTNFFDQGNFAGVQQRNKAICLYALLPLNDTYITSLKTTVVFQSGSQLERVWVGNRPLDWDRLDDPVEPGEWVIVEDGTVYTGILPLEPSCLSRETPILFERGPLGELFLSIYNYRGVSRRLWDYAGPGGAYWRGNLRAGFIIEVAERGEYPSAGDFLAHLRQSVTGDSVDDEFIRTITYRSGEDELELSYDLWNSRPVARRINGRLYRPPSLASPLAVQGCEGRLEVGGARLETNPQPVWLIAQTLDPDQRAWIAVNPQDRPTPVRWETQAGLVTASELGMGRLEWQVAPDGTQSLLIDSLREPAGLSTPPGMRVIQSSRAPAASRSDT